MPLNETRIPRGGPAREALRDRGQFWTPEWVANAMVAYCAANARCIYDPGCGAGAFARALARREATGLDYFGCDSDPSVLEQASAAGTARQFLSNVRVADFLDITELPPGSAIVCNPPYVRHHRLGDVRKEKLRSLALATIGAPLDGRTGLHAYFLLHALRLLGKGQRLCFIVPADICEGVYASRLWAWIGSHFRLDAVVTFAPDATPFPGVDTNPVVLMISEGSPSDTYQLARVKNAHGTALAEWVNAGLQNAQDESMEVIVRGLQDGLRLGVARLPPQGDYQGGFTLGQLVRAMRGIASGANEFFFLTRSQLAQFGVPEQQCVRAIGRTRDVSGAILSLDLLEQLDSQGRPTFLLSPRNVEGVGLERLREYLAVGESLGLPNRPLIAQRKPWFRMESRVPPPFLFAYLGRRNIRFLRNECGVVPLTSFLCIYSRIGESPDQLSHLGEFLNDPMLHASLRLVAKTYGSDAMKLEPRSIERAPLSSEIVDAHPWIQEHLESARGIQLALADAI